MNRNRNVESYVPDFLRDVEPLKSIYNATGFETGNLFTFKDELLDQFFVKRATWGLIYWEHFVGIKENPTLSYERRRENIISKIRGVGTLTKTQIKNLATSFTGGEVEVLEIPEKYKIVVKFVGVKGVPENIGGLIAVLEETKPAHLEIAFEYTYMTWNQHDEFAMTWDQWDQQKLNWKKFEIYGSKKGV